MDGLMIQLDIPEFKGFDRETLSFLKNNHAKNSRIWFETNKELYRRHVLIPFQSLVCDLTPAMLKIDTNFEIRPAVDKTISRIYRDTRFSKDKSLYRENIWFTFKRPSEEWTGSPAFYFELYPTWYRYGMGFYSASSLTMQKFRAAIDADPKKFARVIAFFKKYGYYKLEGEKYKRKKPNTHPAEIAEWFDYKSFYLVCNKKIDRTLMSPDLVGELKIRFSVLKPLYQYLIQLAES
jgi:uncharacterized protein (TIGR02453 family)